MDKPVPFEEVINPTTEVVETTTAVDTTEDKPKRRRRQPGELFVVVTDDGMTIIKYESLVGLKMPNADIYELGRKIKTLIIRPGVRNLLTGEVAEDEIKIEYES